jgi:hypothetical protein
VKSRRDVLFLKYTTSKLFLSVYIAVAELPKSTLNVAIKKEPSDNIGCHQALGYVAKIEKLLQIQTFLSKKLLSVYIR